MIPTEIASAIESIERTQERLRGTIDGLTDGQVHASSVLPGWSRGHVLAHIAVFGEAAVRQLERAVTGSDPGEFHRGGPGGWNAAIEAGAVLPAVEHVARITEVLDRIEGYLDFVVADGAIVSRPTGYQGSSVGALVLAWWRELSINLTDLGLGAEHTLWGPELREHLRGFLAPRVPDGVQLDLEPTDVHEPCRIGQGEVVRVRGTANDLVAWLAGREPLAPITADSGGSEADLPALGPWPARVPV